MREKVRKIRACLMLICALMLMPLTDQALPFEGTAIVAEAAASKKVKLNKSSVKLNKGKSYTLKVYNKGSKKVKWSSKNKKVATVSSNGKVTAKGKGTTYVYAKVSGKTLKCKVSVVVPAPKISKTSVTINRGKSYTLKVSNASSRIKWSSKNKKVATVSSKGKVTAKGKGTTYVYAKVSGKTLKCKVTVKEPAVVKKYTVSYGKSKSLTFSGASSKTKWKSSDSSIVSVSSTKGKKVTAKVKKVGKATVTATTSGKKTYQFVITGKAISKPKFTKTSQTVGKGKTITLSISGKKGKPSSWKSSNTSIATVDSKGKVRCLKSGTVTISCIVDGVVIKTKIVVPGETQAQSSKPSTTPQTEVPVRPSKPETEAPQTGGSVVGTSKDYIEYSETLANHTGYVGDKYGFVPIHYNSKYFGRVVSSNTAVVVIDSVDKSKGVFYYRVVGVGDAKVTVYGSDGVVIFEQYVHAVQREPKPEHIFEDYYVNWGVSERISVGEEKACHITRWDDGYSDGADFRISSSNESVITVNGGKETVGNNFFIKAVGKGTATVTVTSTNVENIIHNSLTITVIDKNEQNDDKPFMYLDRGSSTLVARYDDFIAIALDTSIPIEKISYTLVGVNNKIPELTFWNNDYFAGNVVIYFRAWVKGNFNIIVSGDGLSVTVPVTVTSTEPDWLQYCSWVDTMLSSEWYANGDPVETFKKLGAWLVDNRDYDASNTQFQRLWRMGGDCRAYEMIFIDIAQRCFSLNAYTSNPDGGGHARAIVEISDVKWGFDAGFSGTAGNRKFTAVPSDPSLPAYSYLRGEWSEVY